MPAAAVAAAPRPEPARWEALWQQTGDGSGQTAGRSEREEGPVLWPASAAVADIGEALDWPEVLRHSETTDRLLPLCAMLWPRHPWAVWVRGGDGAPPRAARGAVPWLRRAACLLHGFHLGGCSVRGVIEAMRLPRRGNP